MQQMKYCSLTKRVEIGLVVVVVEFVAAFHYKLSEDSSSSSFDYFYYYLFRKSHVIGSNMCVFGVPSSLKSDREL